MRKVSAVLATVATAAVLLEGAPAATALSTSAVPANSTAAYPFQLVGLQSDNSYFSGRVTWYNRSVSIVGAFHADGCRRVYGTAWAGITPLDERSTSTHCNTDSTETINLVANVPGGSDHVYVSLTDANGKVLDDEYYYRP